MSTRLDIELVRRRLVPTRSAARRAIVEGHVAVDGVEARRPSTPVTAEQVVDLDGAAVRFVGRGGHKLAAALDAFPIGVRSRSALDIGSSTGGFTDCLLQRGARRVLAVDVGTDQLHPSLASDPRVELLEQTDIRSVDPETAGAPFGLVVVDVSFVSLTVLAGVVASFGDEGTDWVVLVKPQFEAGPHLRTRRGVIHDPAVRSTAIAAVESAFGAAGLAVGGRMESPITGRAGNVEMLLWLRREGIA